MLLVMLLETKSKFPADTQDENNFQRPPEATDSIYTALKMESVPTSPASQDSKFHAQGYELISPSASTTSFDDESNSFEDFSIPNRITCFDEASTIQLLRDKEKRIQEEVELRTSAEKDLLKETGLRALAQAELVKENELRMMAQAELNSSKEVNREIRKAISDAKVTARQELDRVEEFLQVRIRELEAEKAILNDTIRSLKAQKEAAYLRMQAEEEKSRQLVFEQASVEEKLNHQLQKLRDDIKHIATSHSKVTEEMEELKAKNMEFKELQAKQACTERQNEQLAKDLDHQQAQNKALENTLRGIHESSRIFAPHDSPPNRSPQQDLTSTQSPPRKRRRSSNYENALACISQDTGLRSPSLAGPGRKSSIHGSPDGGGNKHRLEVRREEKNSI